MDQQQERHKPAARCCTDAPAETPPVSHQTPVETPAVSQSTEAETLISQRVSLRRSWKLKASIAVAALMLIPPVLWLLVENQYLSQTRMGRWVGSVASRRSLEAQPVLSQRRLTANPHDAPLTSGVISPDGKYLAYSDPTGLYLRQVDSGETISVPLRARCIGAVHSKRSSAV
jgi:hypothetical protein